jgi:hypothetical protein
MITGGLVYIAGAWSYHRRRPDPSPAVFGYHEVFHACVCAAATCQYLSIALITARIASLAGAADMSLGSDLAGGGNAMKISRGRAPPFGRGAWPASAHVTVKSFNRSGKLTLDLAKM